MQPNQSRTLQDILELYVNSIKNKPEKFRAQQELFKFAKWFGPTKALSDLKPFEIGDYGEQAIGVGGTQQTIERLQDVRKFLSFAKKKGLIDQNLAQHLRIPKNLSKKNRRPQGKETQTIQLTSEGFTQIVNELDTLKRERTPLADEIRKAAADKDVRENAPLEAAREQLGLVESRIREIEYMLKATIVVTSDQQQEDGQAVRLGSKVLLQDQNTGQETRYTLVSVYEANPLQRRISDQSPVGRALLERTAGQEIVVETPRGRLRYNILKVN